MVGYRQWMGCLVALCLLSAAGRVEAAVSGKAFPVDVTTNMQTTTTNVYVFGDDGGDPNSGPFGIMEGGTGTWKQIPIGTASIWTVNYVVGNKTANLIGVQIGFQLWGVGRDDAGNLLQVRPWTP